MGWLLKRWLPVRDAALDRGWELFHAGRLTFRYLTLISVLLVVTIWQWPGREQGTPVKLRDGPAAVSHLRP